MVAASLTNSGIRQRRAQAIQPASRTGRVAPAEHHPELIRAHRSLFFGD
jgi:hypothetical protein